MWWCTASATATDATSNRCSMIRKPGPPPPLGPSPPPLSPEAMILWRSLRSRVSPRTIIIAGIVLLTMYALLGSHDPQLSGVVFLLLLLFLPLLIVWWMRRSLEGLFGRRRRR